MTEQGTTQATMVGGPVPPTVSSQEAEKPQAPVAPAAPKEESKPLVFFGGKAFKNHEEALMYASSMQQTQKVQAAPSAADVDPASILFEDPTSALKIQEQRIIEKMEKKQQAEKANHDMWTGFYNKYSDLKGFEDLVAIQQSKNWDHIKDLPLDQGLEQLAKHARARLAEVRGNNSVGEKLSSQPAMTAPAGGASAPAVSVPTPKVKNFVDELKEARAAKQKKTA